MTQVYSSKIIKDKLIQKVRRLPIKGEVLVNKGDKVEADKIIAIGKVKNPDIREVKTYIQLDVAPEQVKQYMVKDDGDEVKENEVIAIRRSFFGRKTNTSRSPIEGTIKAFSPITGRVLIRGKPIKMDIKAHIPGIVVETIVQEGATVETRATIIKGIFGVGGENRGILKNAVERPGEPLTTECITESDKGKILVGGSVLTLKALRKASEIGVNGIIVGGIDQKDLISFLGYEIGIGVTGKEDIGLTLIITEGFGINPMHNEVFETLKKYEGKESSIDGSTHIRSRMLRPEIIIPIEN